MPIDEETQVELNKIRDELGAQQDLLSNLMVNGLDALLFKNLFPAASEANGVLRIAARFDHDHDA